jgi:integrase
VIHFDGEIPGYGVRVKPSGVKTYVLKYQTRFGQQRKLTIARVGDLTPEQARTKATKLRALIADGGDPAAERQAARNAMTVAELCDEYLEAEQGRIKASTLLVDKSRIDRHVKPLLGSRPVASLTIDDIEKFLRDVMAGKHIKRVARPDLGGKAKLPRGGVARGGPAVASRTVGMLGTILERAVRRKVLVKNPVRGVKRPQDGSANPMFSFEKVSALGAAMRAAAEENENEVGLRAIRSLLLTGCRRSEILSLKTSVVDRKAQCFRFDDSKSGKQIRAVGKAALDQFGAPAQNGVYVFPSTSKSGHLVGLPKIWERIAARAKLDGVSLHGLRHWFASAAAELGYSDLIIGALLGHAKRGITSRYATAPDPALVAAADTICGALANALDGKIKPDNVVPIRVSS